MSESKKEIVAFMQNMWVREPSRVHRLIGRLPEAEREPFRLELIRRFLFAGCVSGRRLKAAFGEEICRSVVWEESTREIAGDPKTIFPAQPEHIQAVLAQWQPRVVICFGRIAANAVYPLLGKDMAFVQSPHPAARQPDVIDKLKKAAADLQAVLRPLAV